MWATNSGSCRWERTRRFGMGTGCSWIAVLFILSFGAGAQECALDVETKADGSVAYQARGDRCEGVYDQPAANRINLRIAGFHRGAPVFDAQKDEAVRLAVQPQEPGQEVLLQVVSTRRHDYYQMDTRAAGPDGTFTWPLDVARKLDNPLRPFHMAALACVADCAGGASAQPTLLPVSVGPATAKGRAQLTVIAMADVELASLEATLRQRGASLFENLAVGGRYLPPHKPLRIPLPDTAAGEALLSLAARTPGGQPAYLEALLILPERRQ